MAENLSLKALVLRNFRSHQAASWQDIGGLTLFIGPNGAGKTNALEAISLLTTTQSFRRGDVAALMREGSDSAQIFAELTDGNRALTHSLDLQAGKKSYSINDKPKKAQEMRGILPSVAFTPDDLTLAKGSSAPKRDALDALGLQLSANYFIVKRDFEKVLRHKNRLLKDQAETTMIDSINELLITCGSQLFCYRSSLLQRLFPLVARNYAAIAAGQDSAAAYEEFPHNDEAAPHYFESQLSAAYRPSWLVLEGEDELDLTQPLPSRDEVQKIMADYLDSYREQELARGYGVIGPHRDSVEIFLDGRNVATFGSQGQQRTVVLAWKLAEVEMVRQSLGVKPLLLLDDVMSELDPGRRAMLVRLVDQDVQTFITATDLSPFGEDLLDRARVIDLGQNEGASG